MATIACLLTHWAKPSVLVWILNKDKSPECCNGEKEIKPWNSRNVWLRPGAHEKAGRKDFACPYLEPRKVPLAEKA